MYVLTFLFLFETTDFQGTVKQYRLFRAHVNFATDSMLYPYDSQKTKLKFQSLDYGNDKIALTCKTLNNLNGLNPGNQKVTYTSSNITDHILKNIQDGFYTVGFC